MCYICGYTKDLLKVEFFFIEPQKNVITALFYYEKMQQYLIDQRNSPFRRQFDWDDAFE